METDFTGECRVLISGLGLIGGSLAKAFRKAKFAPVCAYDRNAGTLEKAEKDGVITQRFSEIHSGLPEFDLVLCCLPPCFVVPFYQEIQPYLKKGGVFAEFSGVKAAIIEALSKAVEDEHQILSLHPMAGSEKTGYAYSDPDLFLDSLLILTPMETTRDEALRWAELLKTVMGCQKIVELDAAKHDAVIASVSHIPHIAALAIKAMNRDSEQFAGSSYLTMTRIAQINSALWAGLMIDNREYLLKSIALFKQNVDTIEHAIKKGDKQALIELFDNISDKGNDFL